MKFPWDIPQIPDNFELKWYPICNILAVPQLVTATNVNYYVIVVWKFTDQYIL